MARTAGREYSSDDHPVLQPPEIDSTNLDEDIGDRKIHIEAVDPEVLKEQARMDYEKQLGFNEDLLEIYLHRASHEFAPDFERVGVNGVAVPIPVETPCLVKRKYVEVMARSQPLSVTTQVFKPSNPEEAIKNTYHMRRSKTYTFDVRRDPNPRGRIWLEMLLRGG